MKPAIFTIQFRRHVVSFDLNNFQVGWVGRLLGSWLEHTPLLGRNFVQEERNQKAKPATGFKGRGYYVTSQSFQMQLLLRLKWCVVVTTRWWLSMTAAAWHARDVACGVWCCSRQWQLRAKAAGLNPLFQSMALNEASKQKRFAFGHKLPPFTLVPSSLFSPLLCSMQWDWMDDGTQFFSYVGGLGPTKSVRDICIYASQAALKLESFVQ